MKSMKYICLVTSLCIGSYHDLILIKTSFFTEPPNVFRRFNSDTSHLCQSRIKFDLQLINEHNLACDRSPQNSIA